MNKKLYLSIVITCYNEETKIANDIEAVKSFIDVLKKPIELIVVDDRSHDKTVEIVKEKQNKYSWIKPMSVKGNIHGKGIGLKTGILTATGKYVMFVDDGLCVPYNNALLGLKQLKEGADVAIGSRALKKSIISHPQPWYRQVGSRTFWLMLKLFMGLPRGIRDTQCGFKLYAHDTATNLYKDSFTSGFMIDIETILRAKKLKYKITQFPVVWTNDSDSRFNIFSGSIKNFKELWKIKQSL